MRIAILTHVFPPSSHPNSKRPSYYAHALHEAGAEVKVFTSTNCYFANHDESEAPFAVLRIPDPIQNLKLLSVIPRWRHVILSLISSLMWPDIFRCWASIVLRTISEDTHFDKIILFVQPASPLILANQHEFLKSKLIIDYQDSISPYLQIRPYTSFLKRTQIKNIFKKETSILEKADRVVFTSETNRKAYVENRLVNTAKTVHIPYFYQPDDFPEKPVLRDPRSFKIAYFGSFDAHGHRNPKAFLKALALFLKHHPEAVACTKFVFYGIWRTEHNSFIDEYALHSVIERHPPCPYSEYLALLQQQTALLLVVAPEHNLFMPSKVVDYFGAQRPVLGFAPRNSEMWHCLISAGMGDWLVEYENAEAGAAAIERLWQAHQAGTLHVDPEKLKHWSSETQIPRVLDAVLEEK